jgi:2,4-dienoyl-CoA reductase-like NADH-dependent reductase (Old Yellow Enzyme family)
MPARSYIGIGSLRDVSAFKAHVASLGLTLPCDDQILSGSQSPLSMHMNVHGRKVGNRWAIHPMEGWDATRDGRPSENTIRRWKNFGASGAKLIWGGEAFAVRADGRANPHQLFHHSQSKADLTTLRTTLVEAHRATTGSTDDLLVGLQLTHSGRFSVPNEWGKREPQILYRHPLLDRRHNLPPDYPVLSDGDIRQLIEEYHRAAKVADESGFDFVDIKHCHGYLGHEFLSAHTREGAYGGSFENRTRFLREIVQGIRAQCPKLLIGVRVSAFDFVPFRPDPALSSPGKLGPGIPDDYQHLLPYRWGFGLNPNNPLEPDLAEPARFLTLLRDLGIRLVNLTAGSPYYNPHIQRPALYPPSDGYQPPEDPLVGVARQMDAVRQLKQQFPDMLLVGTGYTYVQEYLPHIAQAAVREGWVDSLGIGRMVLSYPQLPWDLLNGNAWQTKRICRTFSDCTTAPRNALPSGCYPLDPHYKQSPQAALLKAAKKK